MARNVRFHRPGGPFRPLISPDCDATILQGAVFHPASTALPEPGTRMPLRSGSVRPKK
ncbi:hypothetical protein ASAP_0635 [Asaia bogorensis]|uniref:Uncharacterized protein n=1 Tax=Asaia bogorensis TaxID=91915 RepID=A0A060QCU2_9PROT|nr:hypothetical protein ASAP_0635 [Asaia bogorensis]